MEILVAPMYKKVYIDVFKGDYDTKTTFVSTILKIMLGKKIFVVVSAFQKSTV